MINRGTMDMTVKLRNNQINERLKTLLDLKNFVGGSNIKTMLICFFDVRGVIHSEFVPTGQTVNQAFYLVVLRRLLNNFWRKSPDLLQFGDWFCSTMPPLTQIFLFNGF